MQLCGHTLSQCIRATANRAAVVTNKVSIGRSNPPRYYASVSASEFQFGQPLHETHPHLLKPGELTPGISSFEYAQRRSKLASKLPKNGIAILAASEVQYKSGAVFHEFHQEANFFYLTGFNEPEAVAVIGISTKPYSRLSEHLLKLGKSSDDSDHVFHLFVRPKDPKTELWDGARSGTQAALDVFNADESGDVNQISRLLSPIVSSATKVYTNFSSETKPKSFFSRFVNEKSSKAEGLAKTLESRSVLPLSDIIHEIRNLKSDAEIANMRKVGQMSGRAYTDAMRQAWDFEKRLAAFMDYKFRMNGCDGPAYIPVVAGGRNGSIIHYTRNDLPLKESELVMVDAGGEYGGYITDITRVWPISGTFNGAQKDLYNAVLATQRHCISLCRANASVSLDGLHEIAETDLKDQLKQLGFDLSGYALDILFPHHLSHYIGLDVHETPGQSRKTCLQARQCVAIEPGIYVPDTDDFPTHFRGMSIRVEDSVCVQDEHPLVLTTEAVKEIDDIEALRN